MPRKSPIDQLRKICLALPEATEKEAWGEPTFRVRDKLFAMFSNNHHGDGRIAVWCKAPPGVQEIVVSSAPERFFVPPYVGHKGWIGINLIGDVNRRDVNWKEVAEFMADSWRMTAPKKLLAELDKKPAAIAAPRGGRTSRLRPDASGGRAR